MKKTAFSLLVVLLITIVFMSACGKSSDIICDSCAAIIPDDSRFCPNCGKELVSDTTGGDTGNQNSASTFPTGDTKHEHSYSESIIPATCQDKGYTLHECACGDIYTDQYTDTIDHIYADYLCQFCGAVDKSQAYGYLCSWISKNGVRQGNLLTVDVMEGSYMYSLVYDQSQHCAYISLSNSLQGEFSFFCIWLDNYSFGAAQGNTSAEGSLAPSSFAQDHALQISSYTGNTDEQESFLLLSKLSLLNLLNWLDAFLVNRDVGITSADLGFTV